MSSRDDVPPSGERAEGFGFAVGALQGPHGGREMIGFVAQRLMELDVDNRCGASHGERSEVRINSRNGFRD